MTGESTADLRLRLRSLGLSDSAISAAWPRWWSEDAEASPSARAELRFSIARRLGLDARSLLGEENEPLFVWREEARFKHLSGEGELERAGITSFGRAIASILLHASPPSAAGISDLSARQIRDDILNAGAPFVSLLDLLSLSWSVSVPVAHLRVFPWPQKRMAAMTVGVGHRWAVLLGKDSQYPATIAFYLAHELGHIALGHIAPNQQIVDLDDDLPASEGADAEEGEADAFALELLTGRPQPIVLSTGTGQVHGRALAHAALESAPDLSIEPGTLALCFGFSTGDWRTANASLKHIYSSPRPVWAYVNGVARQQLDLDGIAPDAADFLETVLGQTDE